MTTEKNGSKPKELSQAQAKGYARDILESISGGSGWDSVTEKFRLLSAGNRKAVLEAVLADVRRSPVKADPQRLLQLCLAGLKFGKSPKPEFVAGMVETVFEVCAAFDTGGRNVGGEILRKLLAAGTGKGDKADAEISHIDLSRLGRSAALPSSLSSLLMDEQADPVIRDSIAVWGRLLGLMISDKGASSEISPEAARRVLQIMSDAALPLPPELVLSVSWIGAIAGGYPETLSRRAPFPALLGSGPAPAGGSPRSEVKPAPKGPRDLLLEGIRKAVDRFESEMEDRRVALSGEIARLTDALARGRSDLENEEAKGRTATQRIRELTEEGRKQRKEITEMEAKLAEAMTELEKWKKEADVLLESRAHQVDDARSESRKEFVRSVRTHLSSLRGFLLELRQAEKSDAAALAATAYDQIIRVLHRQNYLTPDELPRMNGRDSGTPA